MNPAATLWLGLLLPLLNPACAVLAGGVTWVMLRKRRQVQDHELIGHFVVFMVLFLALSFGALRSDTLHGLLDPRFERAARMADDPANAALRRHFPTLWWGLEEDLQAAMREGGEDQARATLQAAHLSFVRQQMPLASADAAGDYAAALLPVMRQLRATQPGDCVRLVWSSEREKLPPVAGLVAPQDWQARQEAIARLVGAVRQAKDREDEPVRRAFDGQAAQAYDGIRATLAPAQAQALQQLEQSGGVQDAAAACDALAEVLTQAPRQPAAVARALLVHVLRAH